MDISGYILYFDPDEHKYTDNKGTVYTSVTTKIDEYVEKFNAKEVARACEKIGRNPAHPKYHKYKGKTRHQLISEWKTGCDKSLIRGNERHNFLEDSVNTANGYNRYIKSRIKKGRIYTILDILDNNNVGEVNLEFFISTGIRDRYPKIYNLIEAFVKAGYRIYSEVCVFSPEDGIAGLVDLLAIKDGKFVIIDWKTNKDDIVFDSGYFEKDAQGKNTGKFIKTNQRFAYPLQHIPQSNGAKYTLQLTSYDYFVELTGLVQQANIICHIRHEVYEDGDKDLEANPEWIGKEKVNILPIEYWKKDYIKLLEDSKKYNQIKQGVNLFSNAEGVELL